MAWTKAVISDSSSVTLRPDRPSTACDGLDPRQAAGDQLVAHQALVLGLALGMIRVHDGEQAGHRGVGGGLGQQHAQLVEQSGDQSPLVTARGAGRTCHPSG